MFRPNNKYAWFGLWCLKGNFASFYMLAKYVPGDIKYIFTKFYRHISTNNWLTRFYHKESSSPHPAIVPMEGAVLFELSIDGTLSEYLNICVTIFGNNQKRNTHFVTR